MTQKPHAAQLLFRQTTVWTDFTFFPPQKYPLNVNYLYKLRRFLLINLAAAPDHEHNTVPPLLENKGNSEVWQMWQTEI